MATTKLWMPKYNTHAYENASGPSKPAHHTLFGNLLRDVVSIPKGIIPGMVQLAKHPIRELKAEAKYTGHFYSPLIHGEFGKFYGNVHAHPLQPLLDAVSVATLAFGGVGAGIKAADTVVNLGRASEVTAAIAEHAVTPGAGMALGRTGAYWDNLYRSVTNNVEASAARVERSRMPGLTQTAERFRKGGPGTYKSLDTGAPGYQVYKEYSHNLFTRAMQKYGFEAPLAAVAKLKVKGNPLGEGGIYDYTLGGRAKRGMELHSSQRKAATGEASRRELKLYHNIDKALRKGQAKGLYNAEEATAGLKIAHARLITAAETWMAQTGVKTYADVAQDLPDGFHLQYQKDTSRVTRPKGAIAHIPAHMNPEGKPVTSMILPNGKEIPIKATTRNVKPGKKAIVLPGRAVEEMQKTTSGKHFIAPPNIIVKDGIAQFEKGSAAKTVTKIGERLGGDAAVTRLKSEAKVYRDAQGRPYYNMIRKGDINALSKGLTEEGERVEKSLSLMARKPIVAWKYAVLSLSPRYYVNNLTNYLMLAMAANPVAVTRGMLDSFRMSHGTKEASQKAVREAENQMNGILDGEIIKYSGNWMDTYFTGIHASNYGSGLESGTFHKVAGVGFNLVEQTIYKRSMAAGTIMAMRSIPAVRELEIMYRGHGMNSYEAFNAAATQMASDPVIHSRVMRMVGDWAGQYYHLNGLEQKLTALVPFYNWDRHALRFAKTLVVEHPTTAAVLGRLGREGQEYSDKELGKLPDFMQGALPIGRASGFLGKIEDVVLGASQNGRNKILLTHGLNPLAAAGENIHAIAALGGAYQGREALGMQANPLLSGIFQGITGENLVTGAKVGHKGGIIGGIATNIGLTPAPVKLVVPLMHNLGGHIGIGSGGWGTPQPKMNKRTHVTKPFLYSKSESQNLRNWLGLNVRDYDASAATAIYNEQNSIKAPKKDTTLFKLPTVHSRSTNSSTTSGFRVRKRRARRPSARTHVSFPPLRKKGLAGIGGVGGIGGL